MNQRMMAYQTSHCRTHVRNQGLSGDMITAQGTVNAPIDALTISGNSVQDGVPSPDNPSPIESVEGDLVVSDGDEKQKSITLPPLRKIGDVADTYNPVTGELTRRIGKYAVTGSEGWRKLDETTTYYATFPSGAFDQSGRAKSLCNSYTYSNSHVDGCFRLNTPFPLLMFTDDRFAGLGDWVSHVTTLYDNEAPIEIYYILEDPVTTYLTPTALATYYPETHIYTDSEISTSLSATVKVMGM